MTSKPVSHMAEFDYAMRRLQDERSTRGREPRALRKGLSDEDAATAFAMARVLGGAREHFFWTWAKAAGMLR